MSVAQICWSVAVVVFLLVELATPSALVSIWLMAGAVAALLVSLVCPVVWVQLTVFLAVSILALAFTRPLVLKKVRTKFVPTNADQTVGMKGRVTQAIAPGEPGRVQVNGLSWAACSDDTLAQGDWCTVQSITGATLHVTAACDKQAQQEEEKVWSM